MASVVGVMYESTFAEATAKMYLIVMRFTKTKVVHTYKVAH